MMPALLPYEQAAAMVADYAAQLGRFQPAIEQLELDQAAGRVLAQPLCADSDQPPFSRSTRDGYACRAQDASSHASSHAPLTLAGATQAGDAPSGPLLPGSAWEIMTGAPVPSGADAVLMLEHVEVEGAPQARTIRLLPPRTVHPGENIVAQGSQGRAGEQLLAPGAVLRFGQIALAASCGYAVVRVFRRPRVAILTTGDELVPVGTAPAPGQIRNSNGPMLASLVTAAGGEAWVLPTAADNAAALDAALAQAVTADLLILSGGVSAGKFDLVEPALARLGAQFHFTGTRMQPGKPTVFGDLPRRNGSASQPPLLPFFGLPGNPISSAVTFLLFAAPVLAALAGSRESYPRFALARLAPKVSRSAKSDLTRFLPAYCNFSAPFSQLPEANFVPWQGSGDLTALASSNCFLIVPEESRNFEPGSIVRILLS